MTSVCDVDRPRAKPRLKLFQPTRLLDASGGESRAHLLDLSATGAQVHAAIPPAKGAHVRIGCGGELRTARVVWVGGSRFGIVFTLPLTTAQVEQAIAGD